MVNCRQRLSFAMPHVERVEVRRRVHRREYAVVLDRGARRERDLGRGIAQAPCSPPAMWCSMIGRARARLRVDDDARMRGRVRPAGLAHVQDQERRGRALDLDVQAVDEQRRIEQRPAAPIRVRGCGESAHQGLGVARAERAQARDLHAAVGRPALVRPIAEQRVAVDDRDRGRDSPAPASEDRDRTRVAASAAGAGASSKLCADSMRRFVWRQLSSRVVGSPSAHDAPHRLARAASRADRAGARATAPRRNAMRAEELMRPGLPGPNRSRAPRVRARASCRRTLDAAGREHVHAVRRDVVEQALIMRDQHDRAVRGRAGC